MAWTFRSAKYKKKQDEARENMERKLQENSRKYKESMQKPKKGHEERSKKLYQDLPQDFTHGKNSSFDSEWDETQVEEKYARGKFHKPGYCLILFNGLHQSEAEELSLIFLSLAFEVRLEKIADRKETKEILRITSRHRLEDKDCFVLLTIAPGNSEHIKCSDGGRIDLHYIIDLFNPYNVMDLEGKPKLLLFQCYEQRQVDTLENTDTKFEPNYKDAFVISSTHRRFLPRFVEQLKANSDSEVTEILDIISEQLMPTTTVKEGLSYVSTLQKKLSLKPRK